MSRRRDGGVAIATDSTGEVDHDWELERVRGTAGVLHARSLPDPVRRIITVLEVDRPALVLGSTQPAEHVDLAALTGSGVELVRRRSGGGAVLLEPGASLWLDVIIPRADSLWDDDVGRAGHWLGGCWRGALAEFGIAAAVHTGGLVVSRWSSMVCFAGLGPGEVSTASGKVVGVSQRRSRSGARFQCLINSRWDPGPLLGLLALSDADRARAADELPGLATGVDRPPSELVSALVARLPA